MVSPTRPRVDMPIEGGFVGMVDREVFDEWLRERAAAAGAERRTGTFERLDRDAGRRGASSAIARKAAARPTRACAPAP